MKTVPKCVVQEIVKNAVIHGQADDINWEGVDYFVITPDGEYIGIDKDDNFVEEAKFSIVATRLKHK